MDNQTKKRIAELEVQVKKLKKLLTEINSRLGTHIFEQEAINVDVEARLTDGDPFI